MRTLLSEKVWVFTFERFTGCNAKNFSVRDRIMTRANAVTLAGIVLATIYFFQCLCGFWLWAIPLIVPLVVLTDGLDGFLADYYDEHSIYGKIMDPFRDRYFTAVLLYNIWIIGGLETYFPIVILVLSELGLVAFYRMVYLSTGKVLDVHWLGKARSAWQWLLSYVIIVQYYWFPVVYFSPVAVVYLISFASVAVCVYTIMFRKW